MFTSYKITIKAFRDFNIGKVYNTSHERNLLKHLTKGRGSLRSPLTAWGGDLKFWKSIPSWFWCVRRKLMPFNSCCKLVYLIPPEIYNFYIFFIWSIDSTTCSCEILKHEFLVCVSFSLAVKLTLFRQLRFNSMLIAEGDCRLRRQHAFLTVW